MNPTISLRPARRLRALASLVPAALVLAAAGTASPQDAQYWTYGYGPIGQLTEGTIVGGVTDLSAVYYNPGALALIEEPRFVVGLNSVDISDIKVPGAAGQGLDFDQNIFDVIPAMVAGQIGEGTDQANRFAFAFLSRHDTDWDLGYNEVHITPGDPAAGAGFGRYRQRIVEYWAGGTWSRRIGRGLAVGISPFFAFRAQRNRQSLTVEEVTPAGSRALFLGQEREYNLVRALAKAGLAWRTGSWELGATVTAPGVKLFSTGKYIFNASLVGDVPVTALSASTQKGLSATYHAPWAAAFGATYRRPRGALHATAEFFSAVPVYDILTPEPAPIAGNDATIDLSFQGQARQVLNYGAGLELRVGKRMVLFGGAARNGSAYVPERETIAAWNMTEMTTGFTLDRGRRKVAFGVGYAWGSGFLPQLVVPPVAAALSDEGSKAHYSRWTFSFGASFGK
jgi:hypothetical protein